MQAGTAAESRVGVQTRAEGESAIVSLIWLATETSLLVLSYCMSLLRHLVVNDKIALVGVAFTCRLREGMPYRLLS